MFVEFRITCQSWIFWCVFLNGRIKITHFLVRLPSVERRIENNFVAIQAAVELAPAAAAAADQRNHKGAKSKRATEKHNIGICALLWR